MIRWRNQRGFTFLELSIVLAMMGMILLIGVPNYKKSVDKARETACRANMKMIETQLEHYYFDHYEYPSAEEAITKLINEKYIKEEPKCPVDNKPYIVDIDGDQSVTVKCSNNHGIAATE